MLFKNASYNIVLRMRQYLSITKNALMELVRQPVYLILMTCSSAFIVFLSGVYYFGFGDDPELVKSSALAVMLFVGLLGSVLSASASLAHEIRTGTSLAVLSKPVTRTCFILAKYSGVALAILIVTYVNTLAALLASRMAFDAYGSPDNLGMMIFYLSIALAYLFGGLSNFFLRRPFVSDTVFLKVLLVSLAFVIINFINKDGQFQKFGENVDWRMVPASILILFALLIIAGIAIACSTRLEMLPTMAACSGFFLFGLFSDYLFGEPASKGAIWANILYAILPNWQHFWVADALEPGKSIPWGYIWNAGLYFVGYSSAIIILAICFFENRELS